MQLYLSGQTAEALQQCERSLETYPQATIVDAVWLLIGDIYREAAKDTEAINAYQQVVARESLSVPKALVISPKFTEKKPTSSTPLLLIPRLLQTTLKTLSLSMLASNLMKL